MKLIKKWALVVVLTLLVTGILLICNGNNSYASNLVLTGDTVGLSITPSNEELFLLRDMLLGETAVSGIEIRNTDNYPFALSVKVQTVENDVQTEADLLEILDIKVFVDGTEITSFPAKGGSHSLGKFAPRQTTQLDIYLALDGERAGNEYQQASAELQWTFEAVSDYKAPGPTPDPDPTPTPDPDPTPSPTPSTPYIPARRPTPVIEDEPEEERNIDEIPVPLAIIEPEVEEEETLPEPEPEPVTIDIPDTPVPLAEMPKTGEASLYISMVCGLIIIAFGMVMIKTAGRSNKKD